MCIAARALKSPRKKGARMSQSGEGSMRRSREGKAKGSKDRSKQKEIGERLRRMKSKRKRRF